MPNDIPGDMKSPPYDQSKSEGATATNSHVDTKKTTESFINQQQEDESFFIPPHNSMLAYPIDDITDAKSFDNWMVYYIMQSRDIEITQKELTKKFNSTSIFLSRAISIVSFVFVASLSALITSIALLPSYTSIFMGMSITSCVVLITAVVFYLCLQNIYAFTEEDIKIVREKTIEGRLIALFKEFFNHEILNIEEDINYHTIAKHLKETAERQDVLDKSIKLNFTIKEILYTEKDTLDQDLNDEVMYKNLAQITKITTDLLSYIFSNIKDKIKDRKIIYFLDQVKDIFLIECLENHKIETFYNIFYNIFIGDEISVEENNLKDSVNGIEAKILDAIKIGIHNFEQKL